MVAVAGVTVTDVATLVATVAATGMEDGDPDEVEAQMHEVHERKSLDLADALEEVLESERFVEQQMSERDRRSRRQRRDGDLTDRTVPSSHSQRADPTRASSVRRPSRVDLEAAAMAAASSEWVAKVGSGDATSAIEARLSSRAIDFDDAAPSCRQCSVDATCTGPACQPSACALPADHQFAAFDMRGSAREDEPGAESESVRQSTGESMQGDAHQVSSYQRRRRHHGPRPGSANVPGYSTARLRQEHRSKYGALEQAAGFRAKHSTGGGGGGGPSVRRASWTAIHETEGVLAETATVDQIRSQRVRL